jgi:YHS domain-containing protein
MSNLFNHPVSFRFIQKIVPVFITVPVAMAFSCNQQSKTPATFHSPAFSSGDTAKPRFTRDMVDNLKDPSCGMPLTAGIEDTLHYNGKVYGFCSDECRDEFKKNPAELAKAAVMKK